MSDKLHQEDKKAEPKESIEIWAYRVENRTRDRGREYLVEYSHGCLYDEPWIIGG